MPEDRRVRAENGRRHHISGPDLPHRGALLVHLNSTNAVHLKPITDHLVAVQPGEDCRMPVALQDDSPRVVSDVVLVGLGHLVTIAG
jgi:hypothetical protein